jgi:hypothetical protein
MPQVRDPKTGRYTSGGGSSVGGAAGTNPRIQKAKAVGGGATAGGNSNSLNTKLSSSEAAQAVNKLNLNSDPNISVYTDEYVSGVKVTFEGKLSGGKSINLWESNFLSTQAQIDELPDMYKKQSAELSRLRSAGYKGL